MYVNLWYQISIYLMKLLLILYTDVTNYLKIQSICIKTSYFLPYLLWLPFI